MKRSGSYAILPAIGLLFLLTACQKPTDDVRPVFKNLTVDGATGRAAVTAGTAFTVEFDATDETALSQYRLRITDSLGNPSDRVYSLNYIADITGNRYHENLHFTIDSMATAGIYRLLGEALDAEGNTSTKAYFVLDMFHEDQANITITSPDFSAPVAVDAGDTIVLQGSVTDAAGLSEVTVNIGAAAVYPTTFHFTDTVLTHFDLSGFHTDDRYIVLPGTLAAGSYPMYVQATNAYGHITRRDGVVVVR